MDHSIHPRTLMDLMNEHWNLGIPKLLISVTGGARNFAMSNKLKNVFRKGLMKAALSTGMSGAKGTAFKRVRMIQNCWQQMDA